MNHSEQMSVIYSEHLIIDDILHVRKTFVKQNVILQNIYFEWNMLTLSLRSVPEGLTSCGGVRRPVASCGVLWRPVASCGGLQDRCDTERVEG